MATSGRRRAFLRERKWILLAIPGALLVVAASLFSALGYRAFRVPTGGMLPTLEVGDQIYARRVTDPASVRQGDVLVFAYPGDRRVSYIKRCVAVAGDTVAVRDGLLFVDGEIYESNFGERDGDHSCVPDWTNPDNCPEPHTQRDQAAYLSRGRNSPNHRWPSGPDAAPYVVPAGHIFMMGDNRYNSQDSRYWGALPLDLVTHRAAFIYWSWGQDGPRFGRVGRKIR